MYITSSSSGPVTPSTGNANSPEPDPISFSKGPSCFCNEVIILSVITIIYLM